MDLKSFISCCHGFGSKNLVDASNNLLSYLAHFYNRNFKYNKCYDLMNIRTPSDKADFKDLRIEPHREKVIKTRFDLIALDNQAYELAVKVDPFVEDLEAFAQIKPCWSILFPVKMYLVDHPEVAKEYRGLQSFGSEVIKFYDSVIEEQFKIDKRSPNYQDHLRLQEMTNRYADLLGMTPIAVNTLMYLEGKEMS